MGNHLPFLKTSERRRNDSDHGQPSLSVEEAASVTPHVAGPISLEPHTHRPLEQGQLHVHVHVHVHSPPPTVTTSRPANAASVTEPKEISDQVETKTLDVSEQSQVPLHVHVETDVPVSATKPGIEPRQRPETSVAVTSEGGSQTRHSTRTSEDGSSGTGKTGHSTRTKRKHKIATRKRQYGELKLMMSLFYS